MTFSAGLYDVEPHVAEIYDQSETYTEDVELIRKHIARMHRLSVGE
jgi:hypothetical protein